MASSGADDRERNDALPSDTEMIQRLWSVHEIRQLVYRYAYAVDFRDSDMYRTLWSKQRPEVAADEINGRSAEQMVKEWPSRGPSILAVCNHLIDFDGESEAHGSVYCRVQVGLGDQFAEQSILYQDRYIMEDGDWRFLVRRHLMWFGELRDTHPFKQSPANWPERQYGSGTLPMAIPSYRQFVDETRGRSDGSG